MPDTTIETQVSTVKSKAEPEAKKTRLVADTKRAYDAVSIAAWATIGRGDLIEMYHQKPTGDPLCARAPFTGPRYGRRAELSTSDNNDYQSVLAWIDKVREHLGRWWDVFTAWDGTRDNRPRRRDSDLRERLEYLAWRFGWTYEIVDTQPSEPGKMRVVATRIPQEAHDEIEAMGDRAAFMRDAIIEKLEREAE